MSYLSISSASSSITSLEPSSSSQRALSNHGSSESLSVHRSLQQLHTTSNSNTPSKWTYISDLAPPTMQNVNILKQLCSKSSSTSSTENVFTNRVNISDLLENPSEHASAETRECTENDNQNLSLPGYTAEAVDDKDTDSSTPLSLWQAYLENCSQLQTVASVRQAQAKQHLRNYLEIWLARHQESQVSSLHLGGS